MLQEAADKFHDLKSEGSWTVTVRFAVANEDRTVLDFQDAGVGEGDFEDVRGEVLQRSMTGRNGLGIDIPIDLPDLRWDLLEQAGSFHFIAELSFENLGESFNREIEVGSGGKPAALGRGKSAAWDDIMDVRMILQGTSPGVKDTEEARQIGADVLSIRGKLFHGLGGSLKQGRVSPSLILSDKGAQLFRDRKRDQEVRTGELALKVFFKPLTGLMVLASRAVAIATGAIDLMRIATGLALIQRQATGFGAAVDDGIDGFEVGFRHPVGVALKVLRSEGAKDLIDGVHDPVPPSRD
jgi:hypothetical protein